MIFQLTFPLVKAVVFDLTGSTPTPPSSDTRITDEGDTRVTPEGDTRVTE